MEGGALEAQNKDVGCVSVLVDVAFGTVGAEINDVGFVILVLAVVDGEPKVANNEVDFDVEELARAKGLGGVSLEVVGFKLTEENGFEEFSHFFESESLIMRLFFITSSGAFSIPYLISTLSPSSSL